jgi:hypothetical protein
LAKWQGRTDHHPFQQQAPGPPHPGDRVQATHEACSPDDGLVQSFDSSYWGLMVLVEDENVEQQMIKFHLAIED